MSSAIAHLLLDQLDCYCGIRMHKKLLLIADCNAVASQNWFHHATGLAHPDCPMPMLAAPQ